MADGVGATGSRAPIPGLVHGGVFAHVEGAGLDPEGVADDAVHDGVGVYGGAEALMPVLLWQIGPVGTPSPAIRVLSRNIVDTGSRLFGDSRSHDFVHIYQASRVAPSELVDGVIDRPQRPRGQPPDAERTLLHVRQSSAPTVRSGWPRERLGWRRRRHAGRGPAAP